MHSIDMIAVLTPILQESLQWNRARIQFLAHFLIALLKVKTVNFAEIACAFGGQAKSDSSYKRIQRFFRSFPIDSTCIAWTIAAMLPLTDTPWILTLDRTNWKFGKSNLNILVLALAYKGIAFPILWTLLPKRGNSNTAERISIMERFIHLFGTEKIQCLTADRVSERLSPERSYNTSEHYHEYSPDTSSRLTPATVTYPGRTRWHLY